MTNIARYIDHTLLRPDATESDIKKLCEEANEYGFASVCVAPTWISKAAKYAKVPITTVADFPHGNALRSDRTNSFRRYPVFGASEIDIVINMGDVKSDRWDGIEGELVYIDQLNQYPKENWGRKLTFKYIVEVGYLTDAELYKIADLLIKYKIDFIKTCTGYGPRGVTVEDITKIKKYVGDRIKIKASGGIKTYDFCRQLIEAGADRIGCSNSINIVKESSENGQGNRVVESSGAY
jgi:deoxyribose-phosphate aldolase